MIVVLRAAPRKEQSTVIFREAAGKKISASASPKPAPALIPRIEGLAMGFLVVPCIMAPDTEKLAPTMMAAKVLGKREVRMITWLLLLLS